MIGSSFIDDMDFDIGGDFFDHIDDLLDFPSEDVDGVVNGGHCNSFQGISPVAQLDTVAASNNGFNSNSTSELATELSVPQEDIAQLEWLSNFVEDSFSVGSITIDHDDPKHHQQQQHPHHYNSTHAKVNSNATITTTTKNKESHQFRTSSPVSVLESSSSSGGKSMLLAPDTVIPGRARSKRPRPAAFHPRPVHPLISPTSSITDPTPTFSSELALELDNFAESRPVNKILRPAGSEEKKKRKKKLPYGLDHSTSAQQLMAVRKCLHCEITKTPQWRAGPLGPKTLCNACGVRYKSGRLFPEYRPAASPTFVASLHSNSHKKVLEMRIKGDQEMTSGGNAFAMTPPPEFVPRSSYLDDDYI